MIKPSLRQEIQLWRQGYRFVVGLDESGRGPLAGPVVAAAVVIFSMKADADLIKIAQKIRAEIDVRDSKLLNVDQRQGLYQKIISHQQIKWGVGIVSEIFIDQYNILEATKLAMQKAVADLKMKHGFLLIDGNFLLPDIYINQKAIPRGDQKVFSIAAASIIAKVTRDKIMKDLHHVYPQYGFNQHKGYGTELHFAQLVKHGPCRIHRRSFHPVSDWS